MEGVPEPLQGAGAGAGPGRGVESRAGLIYSQQYPVETADEAEAQLVVSGEVGRGGKMRAEHTA